MNITFLIGNGFDKGLGLNTGYRDFYEKYCENSAEDDSNIKDFKKMLAEGKKYPDINDWSDFETSFGVHSEDFPTHNDDDYAVQKQRYIARFRHFAKKFNAYLEEEEKRADFSNTKAITTTMDNALSTYYHIQNENKEAIQNLYKSFSSSPLIYNFITFNYTKCIDKCVEAYKKHISNYSSKSVGSMLHLHGYVDDNMIMGVNDPSQIKNPLFAKDQDIIRGIVKPQQSYSVRSNYEKPVIETINKSDIICIYGMSIGETDKKWWKIIANWLAKNDRHVLIILSYDDKYDKRFPFEKIEFTDKVTNRFLQLSEMTEDEQKTIRPRIFVEFNHTVFGMKLAKREALIAQ